MYINELNFPTKGELQKFIMKSTPYDPSLPQWFFDELPKDQYSRAFVWAYPKNSVFGNPVNIYEEARKQGYFIACPYLPESQLPHAHAYLKMQFNIDVEPEELRQFWAATASREYFLIFWEIYLEQNGIESPPETEYTTPEPPAPAEPEPPTAPAPTPKEGDIVIKFKNYLGQDSTLITNEEDLNHLTESCAMTRSEVIAMMIREHKDNEPYFNR